MKHIKKFDDDKDEIENIAESMAYSFSVTCRFYVQSYWSRTRYDIYYNFDSKINSSEFNQKKKTFESRINELGYEILYKLTSGRTINQSDTIDTKSITNIIVLLRKL